jgi:threonine/homoserine/homoserine lactone efflux protein
MLPRLDSSGDDKPMTLADVIAFNLVLAAAIASPGPAMLYAIRTTLASGRAVGLATGAGLGLMAAAWTALALAGLDAVFKLFPWAYWLMKLAGAAYLIWIAIQTWRHASSPVGEAARPHASAFIGGVLVNLANPKSVLFAAAVIVVVFPKGLSLTDKAIIVGNHLMIELLFYSALAMLMSTQTVSRRYLRLKPVLDRVAAGVLGALGVRLLAER